MECTTSLNERDLQNFFDTLDDLKSTKHEFTIGKHNYYVTNTLSYICLYPPRNKINSYLDYLEQSSEHLSNKETQFTSLEFCVALLNEILTNLDPSHKLWYKIKYAIFLLTLATRNYEFSLIYEIYHQVYHN